MGMEILISGVACAVVVALIGCVCMERCARAFRKRRLKAAVGRGVTCAQLTPLLSGCSVDARIHTRGRRSCAHLDAQLPLIAVAAVEGNEKMLRALAEQGADLGFVDSRTNQNLLHMTISSGVTGTALWCINNLPGDSLHKHKPGTPGNSLHIQGLQQGNTHRTGHSVPLAGRGESPLDHKALIHGWIPPNHPGNYGFVSRSFYPAAMTPLQHVLSQNGVGPHPNVQKSPYFLCETLINAGCDVSRMDASYWTTLHYVTSHGKDEDLTSLIIRAAPLHPVLYCRVPESDDEVAIFGSAPLWKMLCTGYSLPSIRLLVEAGYEVRRDRDVMHYVTSSDREAVHERLARQAGCFGWAIETLQSIHRFLETELSSVAPLTRMCRTVIRSAIGGILLQRKLGTLGLPGPIVSYLRLEGITDSEELKRCEEWSTPKMSTRKWL